MQYPKFLQKNDKIGITAPSQGVGDDIASFEKSLATLEKRGYKITETASVRNKGRVSTTGEKRSEELESLIKKREIKMIIFATGGDFLVEMLPFVNWDIIKENQKWLMGYSDPTALLYITTTKLDIATLYGCNAINFNQTKLHKCLQDNLEILSGNIVEQKSFDRYQKNWLEKIETYHLTTPVYWETPNNKEVNIQGRLIGGCLDCLKDLIGTPYDNTKDFIERYKKDGIIWYFDVCELSVEVFYRTLFQMQQANWFQYIKGIIVGRVAVPSCFYEDFSYQDALKELFPDIPLIMNADIGHVPPKMTLINGCIATIKCKDGKGSIEQTLC